MARSKKKKKKKQKQKQAEVKDVKAAEEAPEKAEGSTPDAAEEGSTEEPVEDPPVEKAEEAPAEAVAEETSEPPSEVEESAEETAADEQSPAATEVDQERAQDVEQGRSEQENERRRRYRLNKVLGATLTGSDGSANKARLFVIDISATGFRATDHSPHSEAEYFIEIILTKGQEPFKSKMRVVWSKELTVSGMFQMGCEFIETTAEEKERLEAFITGEREKLENAPKKPIDLGRPWTMIK